MIIHTNKVSLSLQDTDMMKSIGVSVPSTKDGDISHIQGVTMEGPVQKEAGNGTSVYTEAEARQCNMEGVVLDDSQMSPADFISQCTTGEDAKALSDEETPLEEYTSSQLDRAISRIKEERRDKAEAVEEQVEKESEEAKTREMAAMAAIAEQQISSQLVQQMQESNLPITSENVMRLSHAIEMTAEIGSFSEAAMKFFIAQELTITPENIRGSQYSVQRTEVSENRTQESDFSEVEAQVRELLSEHGTEPDEETMKTAKWLYDNNLPVTAEHIYTCEKIEELKEMQPEVLSARIVDNMADGVCPEKANLMKLSVAEAITARRRLEEARLTMSVEAVRNMSAKGIDLDISHLEQIVEELRVQEQQAREALLEETGLPLTEDNARMMENTLRAAKQVLAAPAPFLGKAMELHDADTLERLAQKAIDFTAEYAKAEQSYEAVGTEVRRDLGDTMQKAFQNVDDILEDLAFDRTAQNQRAVRSLAYNQIPLTKENILRIKEYDSRITSLMKELKPPVVGELIRRNINPLEITLEELSEQVSVIQEEVGTEDISFSKYLWKLDHQKAITKEERETMIGVYRLLDKIEKSDGAIAGQLMKEGRELSMSSLLSAVRTRRHIGMDVQVDDEFGGLEQVVASGSSISEQIESAYQSNVAKELRKSLSPTVLREYAGEDLSLEELLEICQKEDSADAEYFQQMVREWQETFAGAGERLQQFLTELDMPDTMANLFFAQNFLKQGSKDISSYWGEEDSEQVLEALDMPEELEEICTKLDEKHKQALAKIREGDDIKYEDIRSVAQMNRRISFYGNLRNYQMYEVPVFTEQGITNCKVTVQSGNSTDKGSLEISMQSPEFGNLQASFKLHKRHIKGFVTVEEKEQVVLCQKRMDEFEKDLEENGFTMDSGRLMEGSRGSLHVGDRAEGTKNSDLYRIAKMFIITMSRKDDVV